MAIDINTHLTSEQATEIFPALFFEEHEAKFGQHPALQAAAHVIRNTQIIVLYDDEVGLSGQMTASEAARKVNAHLASLPGLELGPAPICPQKTPGFFMGMPACFFNEGLGEGVAIFRQTTRVTAAAQTLADLSSVPCTLISPHHTVTTAQLDNLFLLSQLRLLADEIAHTSSKGAYPAYSSVPMARSVGMQKAGIFFEAQDGSPLVMQMYKAARMVSCMARGIPPEELLGFLKMGQICNEMLPMARMDVFIKGQESPPQTEAAVMKLLRRNDWDKPLDPAVMARGLRGAIDGLLSHSPYFRNGKIGMQALLADYAAFHANFFDPACDKKKVKAHLEGLGPTKLSALATFHVLSSALAGLRHITGPHFAGLCPDRDGATARLIQQINFATAPRTQAGMG